MALFGGKEKKQAAKEARDQVMRTLAQHEYLVALIEQILIEAGKIPYEDAKGEKKIQEDNKWLTECQSYYDSRQRTVTVGADLFEIKWADTHQEQYQGTDGKVYSETVEDVHERIGYAYTKNGYKPLSAARIGDTVVDLATVLSCWASVIKEKMQGAFPELEFKNVISNQDKASFTYVVPALEWKEWF